MTTENPTSAPITCDACGRRFAWKPQLAGRKVRCPCGQVMTVPEQQSPTAPEDELYDMAPEPAAPAPRSAIPITAPVHPAGAPGAATPAVDYRRPGVGGLAGEGGRMERYFPDRVKDLYMPLALIAGGTVIEFALSLIATRAGLQGAARSVVYVGLYMVINTVLMLFAIFFVAYMREISFGPVPTAILKLCAISIGPGAIGSLVGFLLGWFPLGGLIGWVVGFVLYFALIGALFDLDESDTWWCVITVFLVKLLVAFVIIGMVLRGMLQGLF